MIDPDALASRSPLVGVPKSPQFVTVDPDGSKTAYPIVMVHLFSDQSLAAIIPAIVANVLKALEVRGVIPPEPVVETNKTDAAS